MQSVPDLLPELETEIGQWRESPEFEETLDEIA